MLKQGLLVTLTGSWRSGWKTSLTDQINDLEMGSICPVLIADLAP